MNAVFILLGTLGALASILGLGLGVYSVFFRGRRGGLAIRVLSRQNYSPQSFGGRAKLQVAGQLLNEVSVINARFVNTSSRALVASDFEIPVSISANNVQLVDSFVTTKEPSDLNIDLIRAGKANDILQFTPGIFKHGEFVACQVIADKIDAKLQVSGRTPVQVRLVEEPTGEPTVSLMVGRIPARQLVALLVTIMSGLFAAVTIALFSLVFGG